VADKYRALYDRQLDLLAAKDHERLIDEQYTEDAELLNVNTPPAIVGSAALKVFFKGYLERLGHVHILSTDKYVESDDSVMFEATIDTAGGVARVYDVFVMRDGRIWRHYAGLLGFTPKQG
jgi:hypothetical protein